MKKLRIVVVEDDKTTQQFLVETLQMHDQTVVATASTGHEMVGAILDRNPDMVVFDIHIPHLNGLAAFQQIIQMRPIAAVAVTEDQADDLLLKAIKAGIYGYLIKPILPLQLFAAVQMAWFNFEERHNLVQKCSTLEQNLADRKLIERAKGILMRRHHWTEEHSFRTIRKVSMNARQTMASLCRQIIEGHADPGKSEVATKT